MGEDRTLRASPLLRGLPDDEITLIAGALRPVAFARGDVIVRQGDRADAAYIIASGEAAVVAPDLTGQEVTLRVFGPNDTFGEVGLVTGEPRTATVKAKTEVAAYLLSINAFERIRPLCPQLVDRLASYADLLEMDRFLQLASPFRGMSKEQIRLIASRMQPIVAAAGAAVVTQGEPGDTFYFVRSGSLDVLKDGKRVHVLGAGDVFGEIALLTGGPRIATVRATSAAELYALSKSDFDAAVRESDTAKGALQELTRIRYRATMGQPIVLPDPVSTLMPFLPAAQRRRYLDLLIVGTLVFAASTLLAITAALPFALYAGLIAGSLVVPIVYVAYLSDTGIVSERPVTIAVTFVLGAILGLPLAFLAERQLGLTGGALGPAFAIAAIEEIAKLLGVVWLLRRTTARFQMDGVIFGAAAGMGFAAFETMLFGFERLEQTGAVLGMLWIRALLAPLGHGTWTAIVSGTVWRQKSARGIRIDLPVILALLVAIGLHGIWDWQPLGGLWNVAWSLVVGAVGLVILRTVVQRATAEEISAVVALNPDLAKASPDAPRLACRVCEQISPPGAHYCVRCGAALVGARAPRAAAEPGRLARVMGGRAMRGLSIALTLVLAVGAAVSALTVSGGAGIALLLSAGADADVVHNGDFKTGLDGWTRVAPKQLKSFGLPIFDPDSAFGSPAAAIEVALGTEGYLEQEIDLPSGFEYTLSFQAGRLTFTEVNAYVAVVDAKGTVTELDRFVPGCTADAAGSGELHTYDLTPYAGQKIKLRLGAFSGSSSSDRRAFFEHVRIQAKLPGISAYQSASGDDDRADCPVRAYALRPGSAALLQLDRGDVEFFRLETHKGYQYTVLVELGSLESARLAVYRPDLALYSVVESDAGTAKALVVPTDDITYFVSVRGLLGRYAGDYTISVVESAIDAK